jgi:hypothetical protein
MDLAVVLERRRKESDIRSSSRLLDCRSGGKSRSGLDSSIPGLQLMRSNLQDRKNLKNRKNHKNRKYRKNRHPADELNWTKLIVGVA